MPRKPAGDAQPDPGEMSFEEAFRRLTDVATTLESGNLTLTDATTRYAEGMTLVQRCNQLLDSAELHISQLKESFEPPPDFEDWEDEEEQADKS